MRLLLHSFAAALVAVSFSAVADVDDVLSYGAPCTGDPSRVAARYAAALALPGKSLVGQRITVPVDLAASRGFGIDADGAFHYRMLFNDVAEGWSWQPQVRPGEADYYRWKFFPLESVVEDRPAYVQEEKIGEPQRTEVQWRYDHFLAFDNAYAFYRHREDDETGFVAHLPAGIGGERVISVHAVATLVEPPLSESTTFWKAIYSRPVDFTLKKRYFIGRLEALVICAADAAGGDAEEVARILPLPADAGGENAQQERAQR